jgi:hypothetical protein
MASKANPGQSYTEESFGHKISQIKLEKGSIEIFGDTVNDGKFGNTRPVSVNVKTGYPAKG